ncbi:hypothetical protein BDR05DRAFT_398244 [Suillus weaverae]|nr:hypothetical protein BDR05DRAFT_398244 [Suillus weaverae]
MKGPHSPQTRVHEGAHAIKVSMSCYSISTGLIYIASLRTDHHIHIRYQRLIYLQCGTLAHLLRASALPPEDVGSMIHIVRSRAPSQPRQNSFTIDPNMGRTDS